MCVCDVVWCECVCVCLMWCVCVCVCVCVYFRSFFFDQKRQRQATAALTRDLLTFARFAPVCSVLGEPQESVSEVFGQA